MESLLMRVKSQSMSNKQWKTKGETVKCKGCSNDYYTAIDKCEDGFCKRCKANLEAEKNLMQK